MEKLLTEGQLIRGTIEVERFLGHGAFAEVYRVKHEFLGRQAMKVFKRLGMTLEDIKENLGEAMLLSKINHPNIVRVFDANTFEIGLGTIGYFTMEHIAGGSLEKHWKSYGMRFVPVAIAHDLVRQVCRGLAVAHQQSPPIVHRDIKPQNILVGLEADGLRARLSDFGLAKRVNPLTLRVTAAGTLGFKAPEVFQQERSDSCAGDVWALGTVLYLLLTDRVPHKVDPDLGWTKNQVFNTTVEAPSSINPEVDEALEAIIFRALQPRPEDRYPTAGAMLEDLEKWQPQKAKVPAVQPLPAQVSKKTVLGPQTKQSPTQAKDMVRRALDAQGTGHLADAADLMEEAFNQMPELREKYESRVKLWRCGIAM